MKLRETAATLFVDEVAAARFELVEQTDRIDVTTEREPDPRWELVDAAGHYHARSTDPTDPHPTLEQVVRLVPCTDPEGCGCDGWDEVGLVCRACREEVRPATRRTPGRRYAPGMRSWSVSATFLDHTDGLDRFLAHLRAPGSLVTVRTEADGETTRFGVAAIDAVHQRSPVADLVETVVSMVGIGALGERGTR